MKRVHERLERPLDSSSVACKAKKVYSKLNVDGLTPEYRRDWGVYMVEHGKSECRSC